MRLIAAVLPAALLAAAPVIAQIATAPQQPGQPQPSRIKAGTYPVDANHTQVSWEVNHLGFSMLEGLFGASGGSITIDPAKPAATKVSVTFRTDDLAVSSAPFARHLKSADFFDVARYPEATFVSTRVVPRGANAAAVTGNLTIKGQTKPVTLDVTFVGAGDNPMSKKANFGFSARGTIKRSDFGLGMAAPAVSDEVRLHINAAFSAA